ncbi:hypothetical protein [Microbacterium sp. NPDC057944]|uniref:hypothetical protein n=1 Tax=Microbacterium sp. NPDC057944 TaxID=3346286 RepID=UPI0036D85E23
MSLADDSSISARVAAVETDYAARFTRTLVGFAVVEGILLALAVVVVYVLELVDPGAGMFIIVGVALLGGLVLSTFLMTHMRGRARAVAQARGENPLF